MSVICMYCELGHLVDSGRLETWATNSKLKTRGGKRRMGENLLINESDHPLHKAAIQSC